ncbi:hypothetical protein J1TS1_25100 [Shouchella clausii]|nr:hypothetical protein J1TS1_25100 [Shouchella clausii]
MVDGLDNDFFVRAYEGGGQIRLSSENDDKDCLICLYTQRWFSCRAMEQALPEENGGPSSF